MSGLSFTANASSVSFTTKGIVLNRGPLFKRWTLLILLPTGKSKVLSTISVRIALLLAPDDGIEPPPEESESSVLPLYESGIY